MGRRTRFPFLLLPQRGLPTDIFLGKGAFRRVVQGRRRNKSDGELRTCVGARGVSEKGVGRVPDVGSRHHKLIPILRRSSVNRVARRICGFTAFSRTLRTALNDRERI